MPDATYESASGMKKLLYLNHPSTVKLVIERADGVPSPETSSIFLTREASVEVALRLIKDAGREDLLAPVPEKKLSERIGEYVRNANGEVLQIARSFTGAIWSSDYAIAIDITGGEHRIYNTPDQTYWSPVKVEVTPAVEETWTVVDDEG